MSTSNKQKTKIFYFGTIYKIAIIFAKAGPKVNIYHGQIINLIFTVLIIWVLSQGTLK